MMWEAGAVAAPFIEQGMEACLDRSSTSWSRAWRASMGERKECVEKGRKKKGKRRRKKGKEREGADWWAPLVDELR